MEADGGRCLDEVRQAELTGKVVSDRLWHRCELKWREEEMFTPRMLTGSWSSEILERKLNSRRSDRKQILGWGRVSHQHQSQRRRKDR